MCVKSIKPLKCSQKVEDKQLRMSNYASQRLAGLWPELRMGVGYCGHAVRRLRHSFGDGAQLKLRDVVIPRDEHREDEE
jgi:hypothetical protein